MKSQSTNLRAAETSRTTQPAYIYYFTYQDGTVLAVTNYDADITVSGGTDFPNPQVFRSAQVDHNPFTETTETASDPVAISLAANDPELKKYFATVPTQQIKVQIYRVNSSTLPGTIAAADIYNDFTGTAVSVSFSGYTISANFLPTILQTDRQVPTIFYQKTCNYSLYGQFCTLDRNVWKIVTTAGTLDRVGKTVTITNLTVNGKTITSETFQGGELWDASGNKIGIICGEMLPSSAGVKLYLNAWLGTFNTGDSITVFPGCLRIVRICDTFFGNAGNFGGHPCIPITNPALNGIIT